jgi:hypothetical protein
MVALALRELVQKVIDEWVKVQRMKLLGKEGRKVLAYTKLWAKSVPATATEGSRQV